MTADQRIRRALQAAAQESAILFRAIVAHDMRDEAVAKRAFEELQTSSKVAVASALGSLAGSPVNLISMGCTDPGGEGSHALIYLHLKGAEDHEEFLRAFAGYINPKILHPSALMTNQIETSVVGK